MQYDFTKPSGQDLASTVALGALKGYLISDQRRYDNQTAQRDQQYKMQSAQQLGDLQLRNQQALEAAALERARATHPDKPEKRDPIADYEAKLLIDKKYGVGHFKDKTAKAPTDPKLDAAIKHKTTQWGNAVENARLGETTTNIMGDQVVRSHHADSVPPPMIAGQPIPPQQWERVAETALKLHISDQEAADRNYAQDLGDQVATDHQIDPQAMLFDIGKLQALPSLKGTNVKIPNIGGKTNLYGLAAMATHGGWSKKAISDLVGEYLSPTPAPASAPESTDVQQLMVNPSGQ